MDLDSLDFDKVADERVAGSDADDVYDEEETAKSKKQKSKLKPIKTMGVTNETAELRKKFKELWIRRRKAWESKFLVGSCLPKDFVYPTAASEKMAKQSWVLGTKKGCGCLPWFLGSARRSAFETPSGPMAALAFFLRTACCHVS